MGLNGFLLFCLVLGVIERGYAAALQGGGGYSYDASAPRSCEASLNGEPNPLQGTCTSLDDCEKYLALPPYPGRKSPCSMKIETCCVKRLCDLSGPISVLATNKKYYCTNVDTNHLRDVFPKGKDDWSHVLSKHGDYWNHPAAPYAIGNFPEWSDRPVCPGTQYYWGDHMEDLGYTMCWIDSPMQMSTTGDGQTSMSQFSPQSAIEGSTTLADNALLDNSFPDTTENNNNNNNNNNFIENEPDEPEY